MKRGFAATGSYVFCEERSVFVIQSPQRGVVFKRRLLLKNSLRWFSFKVVKRGSSGGVGNLVTPNTPNLPYIVVPNSFLGPVPLNNGVLTDVITAIVNIIFSP